MKTVISHPGSGTEHVEAIFNVLGVSLKFVDSAPADYDALLLLGGGDINPAIYSEANKYSYSVNPARDRVESGLFRDALRKGKPVMGICRGMQLMAVLSGAALYQDIYEQRAVVEHGRRHYISLANTPVQNHVPSLVVNSYHHQAVRSAPAGFKVAARSSDGLIESIWRPGVLGVQWHPEMMYKTDARWLRLFAWLLDGLE